MIGSGNCPITTNYKFADELEQNTAGCAPITFEEIVIVMSPLIMIITEIIYFNLRASMANFLHLTE